jgi:hypothetical protein
MGGLEVEVMKFFPVYQRGGSPLKQRGEGAFKIYSEKTVYFIFTE